MRSGSTRTRCSATRRTIYQLRKSIELCTAAYLVAPWSSAFGLFAGQHAAQLAAGAALGLPPLVASYGPALLDRAVLDALCRIEGLSFWDAMRANLVGMAPHPIADDLAGFDFDAFLASLTPANSIDVRHTVGLVDPIDADDQPPGTRVDDGLPETLHEVVRYYGNRYFKLKLSGQPDDDLRAAGRASPACSMRSIRR